MFSRKFSNPTTFGSKTTFKAETVQITSLFEHVHKCGIHIVDVDMYLELHQYWWNCITCLSWRFWWNFLCLVVIFQWILRRSHSNHIKICLYWTAGLLAAIEIHTWGQLRNLSRLRFLSCPDKRGHLPDIHLGFTHPCHPFICGSSFASFLYYGPVRMERLLLVPWDTWDIVMFLFAVILGLATANGGQQEDLALVPSNGSHLPHHPLLPFSVPSVISAPATPSKKG